MIGRSIGNYRIVGRLGEGGMGEVFLATHPELGRKAAVKLLREDLAQDSENVARFLNEARAADAIHHPAIVKVLDMGTMPSGAPYIIMEFLDGETLGARLQRAGRFTTSAAADIAVSIAGALAAAHAAGIVHRDLKPDNLFLIKNERGRDLVKVLDFGIAKLGEPWQKRVSVQTQSGVIMGTPVYMSPELCSGARQVDHRSDVYSMGIILYEMLCGEPPFRSEGFGELAHMHLSVLPMPPRQRNPEIPEGLSDVVLRALAKAPAARFASMTELGAALAPWSSAETVRPPQRRTSRRWLFAASALLLLAASGGAALWFVQSRTAAPRPRAAEIPLPRSLAPTIPRSPPDPPPTVPPAAAKAELSRPPSAGRRAEIRAPGKQRSKTSRDRQQRAKTPSAPPAPEHAEPLPL